MAQEKHTRLFQKKINSHFYQRLQVESHAFSQAIQGISAEDERQTYTTLLLRRLMLLYFLQRQGLLDNDPAYLANRLRSVQERQGKDHFYRSYLLLLFHHHLCKPTCTATPTFVGNVPALALPLFQTHPIEQHTPAIQIADAAFSQLFAFFDCYTWNLQEQQSEAAQNELSPAILGRIFEQQLNQRQTGAYYTQDDVTSYITRNTILPYLLHIIQTHHPQELAPGAALWQLLQDRPERYIPQALQSEKYLPKETQQEYAERRTRYQRLSTQLKMGQIHSIADLITCNLDIALFIQDGIAHCKQPELLLTFYKAIEQISILDPTCGSGAFLCAAAKTLEPLYTRCLDRIQGSVDEHTGTRKVTPLRPSHMGHEEYLEKCRSILKKVQEYPTRRHFILTSIINNNLYGVDIMEEATNLCRIRLFLALAACSTKIEDVPAFASIQWNIVTGNALAGTLHWFKSFPHRMQNGGFDVIVGNPPYIEYSKVKQQYSVAGYATLSYGNLYAAVVERSLELCHVGSYLGLIVPLSICSSGRFEQLRHTMTSRLAQLWLANFEIFPSRLFDGAFQRLSIIIAQHGLMHEKWFIHQYRSVHEHGFIHQHGFLKRTPTPVPPEVDFGGTEIGNGISLIYTTRIQRWYAAERPHLIDLLNYVQTQHVVKATMFPKLASPLQETILHKLVVKAGGSSIASVLYPRKTEHFVYYQEATNYWMKATCRVPHYKKNAAVMEPTHGRFLYFREQRMARVVMALLNSSLFYVWFATFADGFHLSHALVKDFPFWEGLCEQEDLEQLALQLEEDIKEHAQMSTRNTKAHSIELEEFRMSASKELLDEIDRALGVYYGLSDEEVAFVVGFDGKYRMGKESGEKNE